METALSWIYKKWNPKRRISHEHQPPQRQAIPIDSHDLQDPFTSHCWLQPRLRLVVFPVPAPSLTLPCQGQYMELAANMKREILLDVIHV